jgi:hypothetical protein
VGDGSVVVVVVLGSVEVEVDVLVDALDVDLALELLPDEHAAAIASAAAMTTILRRELDACTAGTVLPEATRVADRREPPIGVEIARGASGFNAGCCARRRNPVVCEVRAP